MTIIIFFQSGAYWSLILVIGNHGQFLLHYQYRQKSLIGLALGPATYLRNGLNGLFWVKGTALDPHMLTINGWRNLWSACCTWEDSKRCKSHVLWLLTLSSAFNTLQPRLRGDKLSAAQVDSQSSRLLLPHRRKEHFNTSFLPAAIRPYNTIISPAIWHEYLDSFVFPQTELFLNFFTIN